MSEKPTNPKQALGIKKVPLHCIPCGPLMELGLTMMEGGRKYGTHNYRDMGVKASVYYDAAMRHLIDWWEGEDIDPDSGIHHLIKVVGCMFVLRDSMLMGNCDDNRPLSYPNKLDISKFNKQAAEIIEKYPTCVDPFLEKNKIKQPVLTATEAQRKIAEQIVPVQVKPTIECISEKGWQIRLANGMFLATFRDLSRMDERVWKESTVPLYYETKEKAEHYLSCYLRSQA